MAILFHEVRIYRRDGITAAACARRDLSAREVGTDRAAQTRALKHANRHVAMHQVDLRPGAVAADV